MRTHSLVRSSALARALLVGALALTCCSSDDDDKAANPASDGGTGDASNPTAGSTPSGTVGTIDFSTVESSGFVTVVPASGARSEVTLAYLFFEGSAGAIAACDGELLAKKDTPILAVALARTGSAITAGSYTLSTSQIVDGKFLGSLGIYDGTCKQAKSALVSGTVTVATVADTQITGSVDLQFSGGESITGAFSTTVCARAYETVINQPVKCME